VSWDAQQRPAPWFCVGTFPLGRLGEAGRSDFLEAPMRATLPSARYAGSNKVKRGPVGRGVQLERGFGRLKFRSMGGRKAARRRFETLPERRAIQPLPGPRSANPGLLFAPFRATNEDFARCAESHSRCVAMEPSGVVARPFPPFSLLVRRLARKVHHQGAIAMARISRD